VANQVSSDRKSCVIVVGAGGIGEFLAGNLKLKNTTLVLTNSTEKKTLATKAYLEEIVDETNEIVSIVCDVTSDVSCKSLTNFVESLGGGCDLLLNCVGTHFAVSPFHDAKFSSWQADVESNFIGVARVTHFLLPFVIKSRGLIINFAGGGAASPRENFSSYGSAKAALVRFTETLAVEQKSNGVRVNIIAPGKLPTALTKVAESYDVNVDLVKSVSTSNIQRDHAGFLAVQELVQSLFDGNCKNITGRYLSANWDNYELLKQILGNDTEGLLSDLFTLRRKVGTDFGFGRLDK